MLGGLAAIVGPVSGGQLATVTYWRGVFLFLAAVGVAILAACLVIFKETLLVQQRTPLATSLALKGYPDVAGTASSLLGLARFAFGGIAAPLVG